MPNKDGTGPTGKGPRTGRGLGPCKPNTKQVQRPLGQRRQGQGK